MSESNRAFRLKMGIRSRKKLLKKVSRRDAKTQRTTGFGFHTSAAVGWKKASQIEERNLGIPLEHDTKGTAAIRTIEAW